MIAVKGLVKCHEPKINFGTTPQTLYV